MTREAKRCRMRSCIARPRSKDRPGNSINLFKQKLRCVPHRGDAKACTVMVATLGAHHGVLRRQRLLRRVRPAHREGPSQRVPLAQPRELGSPLGLAAWMPPVTEQPGRGVTSARSMWSNSAPVLKTFAFRAMPNEALMFVYSHV